VLRERIRRFAFTRRGKTHKGDIKDRAKTAYALLTPSDIVVRHQWLFAAAWVEESMEEIETELDFLKRDERIRAARIEALREIWTQRGIEGVQSLLRTSGALGVIGWHLAEAIIAPAQRISFISDCLAVEDGSKRSEEVLAGFLNQLSPENRLETTLNLLSTLSDDRVIRLLKASPFDKHTWSHLKNVNPQVAASYWEEVYPGWMQRESDVNEAVDYLLDAGRPRAAFACAHFALAELETSRLNRLMSEIATVDLEPSGCYRLDAYYVSSALDILQKRVGVTEEEMARLEFMYIRALDHSKHGIPNLERQLSKSPSMYMQLLALTYERSDSGKDPEEWLPRDAEKREAAASMSYVLLDRMRITPGKDPNGTINPTALREWITEVRALCAQHARVVIGDRMIGKLMATLPTGEDGIWPAEAAREVLEDIGSEEIARGIQIGRYNSRGVHFRSPGGDGERALAVQYRTWSRKLMDFPYLARTLESIAAGYDREAVQEDSDTVVRRRLNK
jgi:hypothetical protein